MDTRYSRLRPVCPTILFMQWTWTQLYVSPKPVWTDMEGQIWSCHICQMLTFMIRIFDLLLARVPFLLEIRMMRNQITTQKIWPLTWSLQKISSTQTTTIATMTKLIMQAPAIVAAVMLLGGTVIQLTRFWLIGLFLLA